MEQMIDKHQYVARLNKGKKSRTVIVKLYKMEGIVWSYWGYVSGKVFGGGRYNVYTTSHTNKFTIKRPSGKTKHILGLSIQLLHVYISELSLHASCLRSITFELTIAFCKEFKLQTHLPIWVSFVLQCVTMSLPHTWGEHNTKIFCLQDITPNVNLTCLEEGCQLLIRQFADLFSNSL